MENGVNQQSFVERAKEPRLDVSGLVKTAENGYEITLSYTTETELWPLTANCSSHYVGKTTLDLAKLFTNQLNPFVESCTNPHTEVYVYECLGVATNVDHDEFVSFLKKLKATAVSLNAKLSLVAFPGVRCTYPTIDLCEFQVK